MINIDTGYGLLSDDKPWRRHQKDTFSAQLALCLGNSPVTVKFPAQRPVKPSFEVFFDMCPNKRLSKQSRRWWFETPSRSAWRHCNCKIPFIHLTLKHMIHIIAFNIKTLHWRTCVWKCMLNGPYVLQILYLSTCTPVYVIVMEQILLLCLMFFTNKPPSIMTQAYYSWTSSNKMWMVYLLHIYIYIYIYIYIWLEWIATTRMQHGGTRSLVYNIRSSNAGILVTDTTTKKWCEKRYRKN